MTTESIINEIAAERRVVGIRLLCTSFRVDGERCNTTYDVPCVDCISALSYGEQQDGWAPCPRCGYPVGGKPVGPVFAEIERLDRAEGRQ